MIDVEDSVANQFRLTKESELPTKSHSVKLNPLMAPRAAAQRFNRLSSYEVMCLKCQAATAKETFRYSGPLKRIRAAVVNLKALAIISFVLNFLCTQFPLYSISFIYGRLLSLSKTDIGISANGSL